MRHTSETFDILFMPIHHNIVLFGMFVGDMRDYSLINSGGNRVHTSIYGQCIKTSMFNISNSLLCLFMFPITSSKRDFALRVHNRVKDLYIKNALCSAQLQKPLTATFSLSSIFNVSSLIHKAPPDKS